MVAKRLAMTIMFWILSSAVLVLVTSLILIQKNKTDQANFSQKLISREADLNNAIIKADQYSYEFETSWIVRNASLIPGIGQCLVQKDGKILVNLHYDLNDGSWPLVETSLGNTISYLIKTSPLLPEDIIFILKILLLTSAAGIAIVILIIIGHKKSKSDKRAPSHSNTSPSYETKSHPAQPPQAESGLSPVTVEVARNQEPAPQANRPQAHQVNVKEEFLYRLDKELSRASENAIDISLFMIQSPGLDPEFGFDLAIEEFVHEDLIFSLPDSSLAIILPHLDLDQTMIRAELFLKKGKNKEIEFFKDAAAGVSSRNGRLIDSKRLYKETLTAITKASAKTGKLVGFRADPARYRSFLTHQKI